MNKDMNLYTSFGKTRAQYTKSLQHTLITPRFTVIHRVLQNKKPESLSESLDM